MAIILIILLFLSVFPSMLVGLIAMSFALSGYRAGRPIAIALGVLSLLLAALWRLVMFEVARENHSSEHDWNADLWCLTVLAVFIATVLIVGWWKRNDRFTDVEYDQ